MNNDHHLYTASYCKNKAICKLSYKASAAVNLVFSNVTYDFDIPLKDDEATFKHQTMNDVFLIN